MRTPLDGPSSASASCWAAKPSAPTIRPSAPTPAETLLELAPGTTLPIGLRVDGIIEP
jgi:hypothetical protein